MIVIYIAAWIVVLSVVGILYMSGFPREVTFTVSAFLISTLFWMGLTVVLPWLINKMHEPNVG
jgi:hypothetical protein